MLMLQSFSSGGLIQLPATVEYTLLNYSHQEIRPRLHCLWSSIRRSMLAVMEVDGERDSGQF